MPLDLDALQQERQKWLPLTGEFEGVELLLKPATPGVAQRFRNRMTRLGIFKIRDGNPEVNTGRESAFFEEFAREYVIDWRGDVRPEGTAFNAKTMGMVLEQSRTLYELVSSAVGEDEGFFARNGGGST